MSTPVTFSFGDSPDMADELLDLVIAGVKTATCGALRDFGPEGAELPVVGRQDVILDGQGRPAVRIETLDVSYCLFSEIDLEFALAEGEGDSNVDEWRAGHALYFKRNGGWSMDMELVCERFRVVEIIPRD